MKYRKGVGVGGILKLTLGLMVASLFVSASTFGAVGQAIQQSMDHIQGNTSYTVEVDNSDTLSNISLYVRQRAGNDGCTESRGPLPGGPDFNTVPMQNEEGGYPALEGSYLTSTPNCLGTASTLARGDGAGERVYNQLAETGQDMEGIYSRVKFEITEPVTIETSETRGTPNWLEKRIVGVSKQGYIENVMTTAECDGTDDGGVPPRFLGMGDHYVVFFRPDRAHTDPKRADKFMQEFDEGTVLSPGSDRLDDRVYCHPDGEGYSWGSATISQFDQHPVISATRRLENKIVLCPGDKGYVQMNKGKPLQYDEAGESFWSQSAANFPHIVVTHLGTKPGNTCAPAEMGPAAEFHDVKTIQRIQLPLGAHQQIAATIPDFAENTVEDFVMGYWDEYASQPVEDVRELGGDAADAILNAASNALDTAVGAIGDAISSILGEDTTKSIANALEEEGIDPLTDMVGDVFEVAENAIDGTMLDSLHLELTFTNNHLDMDDDAFGGDFRGGFQIFLYKTGDDSDLNNKFEAEPAGGLYHADVPQGVPGAGELDALQSGWDGNGGIEQLGCYVKAELLLEQKQHKDYPERSEQVWTIWIGDKVDQDGGEGDECEKDGRIDYDRHGIAWGGTSTLDDVTVEVENYYPSDEKLEVTATATANNDGDGNINGARLEVGNQSGSVYNRVNFEPSCTGDSCDVTGNISGLGTDEQVLVKAYFLRNDESQNETMTVDVSDYTSSDEVLGPENWNWDSEYNSTNNIFDVNVTYGDSTGDYNIDSATLTVFNTTDGETQLKQVNCDEWGTSTECRAEMEDLGPGSGNELELNATIEKNDLTYWDTRTLTPP